MSKYVRKTHDEWEIWGDYGYGYDYVVTGEDKKDAYELLRVYRDNEKGVPFKIVKRRIPNSNDNS